VLSGANQAAAIYAVEMSVELARSCRDKNPFVLPKNRESVAEFSNALRQTTSFRTSAYTRVRSPLARNAKWAQKYPHERVSVKINFIDIRSVCQQRGFVQPGPVI